jgi:hypothetical protein
MFILIVANYAVVRLNQGDFVVRNFWKSSAFNPAVCGLILFVGVSFPVVPAYATVPMAGGGCAFAELGTTKMDGAQTEILACLYDPAFPGNAAHLTWWRAGTAGVNLNNLPTLPNPDNGVGCVPPAGSGRKWVLNFDGQNFRCVELP